MTLKSNSKLVRWAYFFKDYPPCYTTLCAFFWRAFVFMPLAWLGIVWSALLLLFLIGYKGFYLAPIPSLIVTLGLIWGVIVPMDRSKAIGRFVDDVVDRVDATVFVRGLKAIKGKFCPIIEIEDMDHE